MLATGFPEENSRILSGARRRGGGVNPDKNTLLRRAEEEGWSPALGRTRSRREAHDHDVLPPPAEQGGENGTIGRKDPLGGGSGRTSAMSESHPHKSDGKKREGAWPISRKKRARKKVGNGPSTPSRKVKFKKR